MENSQSGDPSVWKKFLSKHWKMMMMWVLGGLLAALGAVLVYLWFVGQAQSTGLVPSILGLWTMGHLFTFILNLIFWEIVLIGIPVAVGAIAGYLYWKRLPAEERQEYKRAGLFKTRSRRTDWGNGFSFLVTIGFLIKIYTDGNWNSPFATWTFDYLVNSFVIVLVALVVIIGIPMLIGGAWWLHREIKG